MGLSKGNGSGSQGKEFQDIAEISATNESRKSPEGDQSNVSIVLETKTEITE